MFKLDYRSTHSFSGKDIGDAAAPDIVYECRVHRPDGWTAAVKDWLEGDGESFEGAMAIIGGILVSVTQGGETWQIGDVDNGRQLVHAVEEQNVGYGDIYAKRLALALYDQQVKMEEDRLGNSETPSQVSANGKSQEKLISAAQPAS